MNEALVFGFYIGVFVLGFFFVGTWLKDLLDERRRKKLIVGQEWKKKSRGFYD